jgi:hypothetical protein
MAQAAAQEFPNQLVPAEPRAGFPVDLPLNPDLSSSSSIETKKAFSLLFSKTAQHLSNSPKVASLVLGVFVKLATS